MRRSKSGEPRFAPMAILAEQVAVVVRSFESLGEVGRHPFDDEALTARNPEDLRRRFPVRCVAVLAPGRTAAALLLEARDELGRHPVRDLLVVGRRLVVVGHVAVLALHAEEMREAAHDRVDLTLAARSCRGTRVLLPKRLR